MTLNLNYDKKNHIKFIVALCFFVIIALVLLFVYRVDRLISIDGKVDGNALGWPVRGSPQRTLVPSSCGFRLKNLRSYDCFDFHSLRPNRKNVTLPVVRINAPSSFDNKTAVMGEGKSALLVIAGGPGQGLQTSEASVDSWLKRADDMQLEMDLILVDVHGVKNSSAFWSCNEYEALNEELVAQDLSLLQESLLLQPVTRACLQQYDRTLKDEFDLASGLATISSFGNAADLSDVLSGLHYTNWNLWGTSYGTRVALLMASDERVSSLLLDSVYPFNKGRISEWPALLDNSFQIHESHWGESFVKDDTYTELFYAAYESLGDTRKTSAKPTYKAIPKTKSKTISQSKSKAISQTKSKTSRKVPAKTYVLEHWDTGKDIELVLNQSRLLALHFFVLYDEGLLPLYYDALSQLTNELNDSDAESSLMVVLESFVSNSFDWNFASMVFFATECHDNPLEPLDVYLGAVAESRHSALLSKTDWDADICRETIFDPARRLMPERYTAKSTLMVVGSLDPVTPLTWSLELNDELKISAVIEVSSMGHAPLGSLKCDWSALNDFWQLGIMPNNLSCEGVETTIH